MFPIWINKNAVSAPTACAISADRQQREQVNRAQLSQGSCCWSPNCPPKVRQACKSEHEDSRIQLVRTYEILWTFGINRTSFCCGSFVCTLFSELRTPDSGLQAPRPKTYCARPIRRNWCTHVRYWVYKYVLKYFSGKSNPFFYRNRSINALCSFFFSKTLA